MTTSNRPLNRRLYRDLGAGEARRGISMAWRQGSRKRANDAASFEVRLRPQDRVGGPPKGRGGGRPRPGAFRLFPKRKGRAGKSAGKGVGLSIQIRAPRIMAAIAVTT